MERTYFLVQVQSSEWSSEIIYIADSLEEATTFLSQDEGHWYAPPATGYIKQVSKQNKELAKWRMFRGQLSKE